MINEVTDHGETVIDDGKATPRLQAFFDSIALLLNQNRDPLFTVATVPPADKNRGMTIQVTDEVGGETKAFSDGVNWRRVQDRVIISV